MKKAFYFLAGIFLFSHSLFVNAQVITSSEIDALAERTLKTFDVPGIAVAVVKDGKIIHAKGYGVRSLNTKQKVDENTLFGIASNSKAFTSAARAARLLVGVRGGDLFGDPHRGNHAGDHGRCDLPLSPRQVLCGARDADR